MADSETSHKNKCPVPEGLVTDTATKHSALSRLVGTMSTFFPRENSTTSFWLDEADDFSKHRTTEDLPKEVDVVIIGSGYAGTSVVTHLQELRPDLSVAMFEARDVCSGATGRNGGHIKPFGHRYFDLYEKMWGERGAAEIANSEFDTLWALKKVIDDNKIDCDFFLTRACDVYPEKNDPRIDKDMKSFELMMQSTLVKDELKKQIQILYGDAARMVSKHVTTDIAVTYPAAQCWPRKLMVALLKNAVDRGLNLQANTLVQEVVAQNGKWLVKTARGDTLCSKVAYCTNGYTKALLSEFNDAIVPQRGVCTSMTPKDTTRPIPHLTNTYGLLSQKPVNDYLINRVDGTIIVGGQYSSQFADGPAPLDGFFDMVDDTCVSKRSIEVFNESYMSDRFSTWKDTPVDVKHWTGIMGFTNDFVPYVGELDCIGRKNAYIAAGFQGHGMPRVWLAGKAIAKCIAEEKNIKEIEYTCPTPFHITKERLEGENLYRKGLLASTQLS